jgi:predicted RNase H-like HicB family nuclease
VAQLLFPADADPQPAGSQVRYHSACGPAPLKLGPLARRDRNKAAGILCYARSMKAYTAVVERCPDTGLYVGFVPGFPGAHSQAESLDELNANLREAIEMLLEDGEPPVQSEFVGTQLVRVG